MCVSSFSHVMWRTLLLLFAFTSVVQATQSKPAPNPLTSHQRTVQFSTAGFHAQVNSPRTVKSFNLDWRFNFGAIYKPNAEHVTIPHGIELVPLASSGGHNFQGVVYYQKRYQITGTNHSSYLHFEGVMGKSKVFIDGKLVLEHFGGYLPFEVPLPADNKPHTVSIVADNSNDPTYPPGKPQFALDYTYMGGVYRDVWLVQTAPTTTLIPESVYFRTKAIKGNTATVVLTARAKVDAPAILSCTLQGVTTHATLTPEAPEATLTFDVPNVICWSPQNPHLYDVTLTLAPSATPERVTDAFLIKAGIRTVDFRAKDGFFLNGKPYGKLLLGGNRHQDFAVVGNAVSNSLHVRDALLMKDIGMDIVRNAHCPQDPAFMDACDQLGLFVIVNNPGWQFWNKAPIFAKRVIEDIRALVRRDRNHPSVIFWEPVLNETYYPVEQAKRWQEVVHEEAPGDFCASDYHARGANLYPILYPHGQYHQLEKTSPGITYFVREWGDCVDNWSSHNSPSRCARVWGEIPQLIQAQHYGEPGYAATSLASINTAPPEYIGGTLWHTFDHQRGYHPDAFYGGLFDAFRQPKYSAQLFESQRDPATHPYIAIAHEMTPFSPADVTIYSNCDKVTLTADYGAKDIKTYTAHRDPNHVGMKYPVITFKNVWAHMRDKLGDQKRSAFTARGYDANGKEVAIAIRKPSRRSTTLKLELQDAGIAPEADGSDLVVAVATLTDGTTVKRLSQEHITFTIQGEGEIVASTATSTNPMPLQWGTAPVLIRTTTKPGDITLTASLTYGGEQKAKPISLTFTTHPPAIPLHPSLPSEVANVSSKGEATMSESKDKGEAPSKEELEKALQDAQKQQTAFGEF